MPEASVEVVTVDAPVLQEAPQPERHGESISKLASNRFSVRVETDVYDLAAAMDKASDLLAVGVVDENGAPVGIISRRHLFDHLGKMYGRDLYKRKQVSDLVKPAPVLRDDLNIFGVAEILRGDLRRMEDTWYVLVNAAGAFSGVFSSKNLLIYLSETTARDIELARRLQTAIVHERLQVEDKRFALVCSSRMAKEVGGDFYVAKELDAKRLLVGLCDVSGKGIAASLVTAVLGGIFDTYSARSSLSDFLKGLNRYLYETFQLDYFVTGVFMELDRESGQATICDMGHSYLLVMRGTTLMRPGKKAPNPPLGVDPEATPRLSHYRLEHGDLTFFFTDGVVEQKNREGEDYSEMRVWKMLRTHASMPGPAPRRCPCRRYRKLPRRAAAR